MFNNVTVLKNSNSEWTCLLNILLKLETNKTQLLEFNDIVQSIYFCLKFFLQETGLLFLLLWHKWHIGYSFWPVDNRQVEPRWLLQVT